MWRRLTVVLLGLAILVLSGCEKKPGMNTLAGQYLPLQALRGHWVFINYWAEWCEPCIEEITQLNQFSQRHSPQVLVVGVNFDGVKGPELQQLVQRLGIEFAVVPEDPALLLGLPRPTALPSTFVLSPDGKLHDKLLGPQTSASLQAILP